MRKGYSRRPRRRTVRSSSGRPRYPSVEVKPIGKAMVAPRPGACVSDATDAWVHPRPPRQAMVHVTRRAREPTRRSETHPPRTDIAHTACRESPYTPVGCLRVAPLLSRQPPHASAGRPSDSPQTALAFAPSRLCIRSGFCARRTGQIDLEAVQLQYEELHTSMVHGSDRSASARLTPTNPCAAPAGGCRRGPRTGRRASSVRCAAHP